MVYLELKQAFEAHADQEKSQKMADYMRGRFSFYGIQAKDRRQLYNSFIKDAKRSKQVDWELLSKCYAEPNREWHYFVTDYLIAMVKFLKFEDIELFMPFIKTQQWWDTIDVFDGIIGQIGLKDGRVKDLIRLWSKDADFWLRRIAIDHQLAYKDQTDTELLAEVITNNFGSDEYFINKAIGWSLREYSKTNPIWVKEFIETYYKDLNILSIREGQKYVKG